jgi:hypothetical protein
MVHRREEVRSLQLPNSIYAEVCVRPDNQLQLYFWLYVQLPLRIGTSRYILTFKSDFIPSINLKSW